MLSLTIHITGPFVLTVYKNHGRDTNQCLNAKELEVTYYQFLQSIDMITSHLSEGPQLKKMLTDWTHDGI